MIALPWPEPQLPKYRAGQHGVWRCERTRKLDGWTTGYFRLHPVQEPGWMIKKRNTIWMSLAAMERESQMPHIAAASGHVVVAGLGMGFVTYNIARKPDVTKVTVLERDRRVVELMDRISNWRSWPKVELVIGDALQWKPDEPVDFLYVDIWAKLGEETALPTMTVPIQANVQAKRVGSWGQEIDFLDWCRAKNIHAFDVIEPHWQSFAADNGLPLIGEEWPGYVRLAVAAAVLQTINPRVADARMRRSLLLVYYSLVDAPPHARVIPDSVDAFLGWEWRR